MYQSRAGDVRTLFPAFQAGKDGFPCIPLRARQGVCVGGETSQRLTTTLFFQNWTLLYVKEGMESVGC